ncbi:CaiB/BaiF CoA transferase family protein [Thermodesulfobacteriota bacterium]
MPQQALEGVKILDFGWAIVGSLATKQLADHGAQVIRVESITRMDLTRLSRQVSVSTATNPDDKPYFNHLNTSKYSLSLNLKHPGARQIIDRLIEWADVVTENFTPGTMQKLGFGYDYIRTINPDIIMVSGSLYGQTGPMALEWGVNGTGNALSGRFDLSGWPDREPLEPTSAVYGDAVLPFFIASAVVAALDYRQKTGKGQYIDASMLEICVHQISPALLDWIINANMQTRTGNRIPYAAPHGVFPCLGDDRWCALAVFTDDDWARFCGVLGDLPWTKETKFSDLPSRKQNEDELENLVSQWTIKYSAEKIMQKMQAAGLPAGVVQNGQDILENDPQLKEREFLVPLAHPVLGVFGHPAPPYKLLKTKSQVKTSPCLGEHNDYICTKILGMADDEFVELVQDGVFT